MSRLDSVQSHVAIDQHPKTDKKHHDLSREVLLTKGSKTRLQPLKIKAAPRTSPQSLDWPEWQDCHAGIFDIDYTEFWKSE
jgi:hypothetical protein